METVTEQPIKKIEFFRCPQSLPGVAPLTKKPEDSGYEIDATVAADTASCVPNKSTCFLESTHFALSIKAISPEAIAVAAELAPKSSVHAFFVSAVICKKIVKVG